MKKKLTTSKNKGIEIVRKDHEIVKEKSEEKWKSTIQISKIASKKIIIIIIIHGVQG